MQISGTMFERYGGLPFVTRLILRFYDRVLASGRLAPFFANTDMQRLIEHQAKFLSTVMGGPASYSDVVLHDTHRHLNIDDQAFDEMMSLLRETLEGASIAHADIETIIADLDARRTHIVGAVRPM